jgi:hypothetical protein
MKHDFPHDPVRERVMEINKTTLERAFDLARSGEFARVEELIRRLKAEGYKQSQIEGYVLRKQLIKLIRSSHERHEA